MLHNTHNDINGLFKFDPQDERIFCPFINKNGKPGHGLLKKFFIPHLGLNICEYCELEEDGEMRNLSYYQFNRLSRHLIHELHNWRDEILRFQSFNKSNDTNVVVQSLTEHNKYLENAKQNIVKCQDEIVKFKKFFEDKVLNFFNFLNEIMLIKDFIDELKFNEKGKLNLVGIGVDKEKEAKYIWMSLLFANMKREKLDPENFGLCQDIISCMENFIENFISATQDSYNFIYHLCYKLVPEIARLENKNINYKFEELLKRFPSSNNNINDINNPHLLDISTFHQLQDEVVQLKSIISEKESEIKKLKQEIPNISENLNSVREKNIIITKLKASLDELKKEKLESCNTNELLRKDLKYMKESYEKIFHENSELEKLICEERSNYNEIIISLRNKIKELNQKIQNTSSNSLINIVTSNNPYSIKIIQLEKTLSQMQEKNDDLQNKINNLTNELSATKCNKNSLLKQIQPMTNKNEPINTTNTEDCKIKEVNDSKLNVHENDIKSYSIIDSSLNNNFSFFKKTLYDKNTYFTPLPKEFEKISESKIISLDNVNSKELKNINQEIPLLYQSIQPRGSFDIIQSITVDSDFSISNIFGHNNPPSNQSVGKYMKDIDFINVKPQNLLMNHSSLNMISSWLNEIYNKNSKYKLRLLYKASQESFSAITFKLLCNGVKSTVTIALTSGNQRVGGYTPLVWDVYANNQLIDKDNKSFIFSINQQSYYKIKENKFAITNKEYYGPIFGENDLEFRDKFNEFIFYPEQTALGKSFNYTGSKVDFFGAQKAVILDLEVYEIYETKSFNNNL